MSSVGSVRNSDQIGDDVCGFCCSFGRIVVGGSGGSTTAQFDVPPSHKFVGLYGGYGGHLHHVGIITGESPADQTSDDLVLPLDEPYASTEGASCLTLRQLLELCERHDLQDCFPQCACFPFLLAM